MIRIPNALARIAAAALLAVLVVVPPVLIAVLIGRPYPDWSTLTTEFDTGRVTADTVMRIAALLFMVIWVWIVAAIAGELHRLTTRRPTGTTRTRDTTGAAGRRVTFVHRLVRVAVLGTVTTAATVSSWPTAAFATPNRSLADSLQSPVPVTAPVDPTATVASAPATTTVVANGRDTPLSLAVDLGDETLRDDIIAMNRSSDWNGGVFPAGMIVTVPAVETATPTTPTGPTATYVVQPNDGMWNVAQALLGDGSRHHELPQLLDGQHVAPGVTFTAATSTIHPGWVFQLPQPNEPVAADVHVVDRGDTLSGIAEQHLGDAARWPELWDFNAHRTMPDGRTFDDPNLIIPGWTIDLPGHPPAEPAPDPPPAPAPPDQLPAPTVERVTPPPALPVTPATPVPPAPQASPTPPPVMSPTTGAASTPDTQPDQSAAEHSIWTDIERSIWPTIAAGSLLLVGLATAVRRLRNRRLSRLQPGERLPEPIDAVAGTEHALAVRAADASADTLAALLRSFTPHAARLPSPLAVRAVQVGAKRIELLLARPEPHTPRGWSTIDGGQSWTHRYDQPIDEHRQLLTPALVTIGTRTDEHADEVLLDLETAGSIAITGDRTSSLGLIRSIALELATYPLGVSMDVSLVGIDLPPAEHCDRVWADTTIERALAVARRRHATHTARDRSITETRAALDADDGSTDPHVILIDAATLDDEQQPLLDELVQLCEPSSGTAVVIVGDHPDANERIAIDDHMALWSGVDLNPPNVTGPALAEVHDLFEHTAAARAEQWAPDDFITSLTPPDEAGDLDDSLDDELTYQPPPYDVLVQLMGEPRAHGIELSGDQTELLALLSCLRHRAEVHIGLIHEAIGPDRARKTIENRTSQLRRALGVGSDGHDLMPDAAPGRGGRSHYLVGPLVLTDIDLLEHRYHASQQLSTGDALEVLRDGLDLMNGPLFRSRRGYEFWPHSEGVIVDATNIIQSYACRLIDLAADAGDPALVLRTASLASCVLDNPLAEFPFRQAEQAAADTSGDERLIASVDEARRRLLEHIDTDDTYAEAG